MCQGPSSPRRGLGRRRRGVVVGVGGGRGAAPRAAVARPGGAAGQGGCGRHQRDRPRQRREDSDAGDALRRQRSARRCGTARCSTSRAASSTRSARTSTSTISRATCGSCGWRPRRPRRSARTRCGPGVVSGVAGYTGAGIGVAVIDSGMARAPALNGQVVVTVDFTGDKARRQDRVRARHARGGDHRRHGRGVSGRGAGGAAAEPAGDGRGRIGRDERRDCGDRLGGGPPCRVQHPHHQPVAGPSGARAGGGRSAVPGGGSARSMRASWWWRRPAIYGKTSDGRPIVGGIVSPGNAPAALTVGALNTQGHGARGRTT